jgi:TRAP-type C4-dicarboxylate transport system permease small subunit
MTKSNASAADRVWDAIEREKHRDRSLRRIGLSAWSVTFVFVLLLAVMVGTQVAEMWKGYVAGALPWMSVVGVAMPFVIVLALLSVLIATLTTIGIFIRSRTATLNEIQLRLAALEDMIVSGSSRSRVESQ